MSDNESCLSAAIDDVTESPRWLGTLLLLGLTNCVPILNFVVMGYGLTWARELVLGQDKPLPRTLFANGTFKRGFFANLMLLAVGALAFVVCIILFLVPGGLGFVILLPLAVFFITFVEAGLVRMVVTGRASSVLDVPIMWRASRTTPGLYSAALVPSLVAIVVSIFAAFLVAALVNPSSLGDLSFMDYSSLSFELWGSVLSGTAGVAQLLTGAFGTVAAGIAEVVSLRAVGHWTHRAFPELVSDL